MSQPNHDVLAAPVTGPELFPDPADAVSLVSCGVTFVQFFLHLQDQKIPETAQSIAPWRWSIRAPVC